MRSLPALLALAGISAACSDNTAPRIEDPTALAGVWDWTEHFADAVNSATCDDTGSYVFGVSGTGFVGRSDQVGVCQDPSGLFDNTSGDTVVGGSVSGGKVQFTVGASATCQYSALLTGSPDHLAGSATCGTAKGTWTADRGLTVTSATVDPDSSGIPVNAVMPLVLALRNTLGNRVFRRPVTWSSDNPTIVPVDSVGRVSALQPGTARIQGSAGGLSSVGTITVGGALVTDVAADTFGTTPPQFDLSAFSAAADSGFLTVAIRLTKPLTAGFAAFIDLDVDQDSTTGVQGLVDAVRPDALQSSGLGIEFLGDLTSGILYDAVSGSPVAIGPVFFDPVTVTVVVRYPMSAVGSLQVNMAVVVGNSSVPTDIAPDVGHLTLGGTVASVARSGPAATRRSPISWGGTVRLLAPYQPRRGKTPH